MTKRILTLILCLVMVITCFTTITSASSFNYRPPFETSAQSVCLVNVENNLVIYDKNMTEQVHPGDLAQVMTVILALELVQDLSAEVTLKSSIENDMYIKGQELGRIRLAGLYRNETISVRNLLYAVMLNSANEAATMLADYIGDGSIDHFVTLMNERAAQLGATNTMFMSPHGLPGDNSYTTAYDMYLIARHALTLPGFIEIANTTTYNGGPTNLQERLDWNTTNRMLVSTSPSYYPALSGIKTAFNEQSGACMVSQAERDGYSYILVVMNAPTVDANGAAFEENQSFAETRQIYDWAFSTFRVKTLLEKGRSFGEIPLELAWDKDFLRLMSGESYSALVPDDIDQSSFQFNTSLPETIDAPIAKGDVVGEVEVVYAGEVMAVVPLVSGETVEASEMLMYGREVEAFLSSFWFKFIVVFVISLIVLYIVLMVTRNRDRRNGGMGRGRGRR